MSFSLLDISIIVLSLGGIFVIIARKIPAVASLDEKKEIVKADSTSIIDDMAVMKDKSFFTFKAKIEYRKSIIKFACFLEKILRKIRLNVLKIDNLFNQWIAILRENTKSNAKNLSIEKSKLFDYKMGKFKEAAQKWQSQAYHMIEDGVGKSLVMITPDNSRNKKVIIKKQAEKHQKAEPVQVAKIAEPVKEEKKWPAAEESKIFSATPKPSADPVLTDPISAITEVFEDEKVYIERIAKNPRNIEAYRKLGRLYIIQKNYGDALSSFMEIVKNKRNDIEAQNMILKINDLMKRKID